jgi:hypothetical protein
MTLFEAIYGQKPPLVLYYMPGVLKVQEVHQMLTVHKVILHNLKENLIMA